MIRIIQQTATALATRLIVSAVVLYCTNPVNALTINVHYVERQTPSFDPTGAGLMAIAHVAGDIWESYFPASSDTIDVDMSWDNVGGLGQWNLQIGGNNNIRIDTQNGGVNRAWFFDPTPLLNEEYTLVSTPYSTNGAGYNAPLPATFEVGYRGNLAAMPPAAAVNAFDLLSTVIHEIGHELGINNAEPLEGDWELTDSHVGGLSGSVQGGTGGHIAPPLVLMCNACGNTNLRRLPSATDILVIADEDYNGDPVDLPRTDFISGTSFHTASNWIGNAVPDSNTAAYIRANLASPVNMTTNTTVGELILGDALNGNSTTLDLDPSVVLTSAAVTQTARVTNGNVTLNLASSINLDSNAILNAENVNLAGASTIALTNATLLFDTLTTAAGATVRGSGDLGSNVGGVDPPALLVNDGIIRPEGGTLTINGDTTTATLQLDGSNGNGGLNATNGTLIIKGRTLGPYTGFATVGPNQSLEFENGWNLSNPGVLNLLGTPGNPATLSSGQFPIDHVQVSGGINVTSDAIIAGDIHLFTNAAVDLPEANLDLTGSLTQYQAVTITGSNGTLQQSGDAIITATLSNITTSINTTVFDMDGNTESLTQSIDISTNTRLQINSDQIETGDPTLDGYDGTLNIRGILQANPIAPWRLDGTAHLSDGATMHGSPINLYGRIDTDLGADGSAAVHAQLNLHTGYMVAATSAADTLTLENLTTAEGPGTITGFGLLRQVGDLHLFADLTIPSTLNYDWDGEESAPSRTLINPNRTLTINAPAIDQDTPIDDGHDGVIDIVSGTLLVNTPSDWRIDGTVNMQKSILSPNPILGGTATIQLHGTLNSNTGVSVIQAPIVLNPGSIVHVPIDSLQFDAHTTYAGGNITNAALAARVDQHADATVTGNSTISVRTYNFDGLETSPSTTTINQAASLTINTDAIDAFDPDPNTYDGHIDLQGGALTVNLPGTDAWTLGDPFDPASVGRIDLTGIGLNVPSINGSPLISQGTIAAHGLTSINADLTMTDASVIRTDTVDDTIIFGGHTTYQTLAAFTGVGRILQYGDALVTGPTDTDGVRTGTFDMDGQETAPANFTILFDGSFGSESAFVINADQIERGDPTTDGYDGTLALTQYVLEVNTAAPWRLDGTLELNAVGANLPRLRGSQVNIHGTVDVNGQGGRMQAPVQFESTAMVNVDAGETLFLDGTTFYNGGSYTGLGIIQHNADVEVHADTTMNVEFVDFDGATEFGSIKVLTGTLVVNAKQIDTTDNTFDGSLSILTGVGIMTSSPWTANGQIEMFTNATIAGAHLIANATITGNGLIKTEGLTVNGGLFADNGTLTIGTGTFPDLDGDLNNAPIEAITGDVVVQSDPGAMVPYLGSLVVGNSRTFSMLSHGLLNIDTIHLRGGTYQAPRYVQQGKLTVSVAPSTLDADSVLLATSATTLDDDLLIRNRLVIEDGARFEGAGSLRLQPDADLFADATLDVDIINEGGTVHPGSSPGTIKLDGSFTNTSGTVHLEVQAPTPTDSTPKSGVDYDFLSISDTASLAGNLHVELLNPSTRPDLGVEYDVMSFGTRRGTMFATITGTLIDTEFALAPLFSEKDLMLRASIPGDLNLDNMVSVADLSTFALNFNTTTGLHDEITGQSSWLLGDFNTDGAITVADLSLLALNFGFDASDPANPIPTIGLSIDAVAAIAGIDPTALPEPNSAAAVISMAFVGFTRRKR